MCTAVSLKSNSGTYLFGRNMDIEYYFGQSPMFVPRKYKYENRATKGIEIMKYAVLGMGIAVDEIPLFAEVMNEKGLACAGLNFPDAVWEESCREDYVNMPPYQFPLWITGNFGSVEEVLEHIHLIKLVAVPVNEHYPLPTLHFMVSDKKGRSIVIEALDGVWNVYENTIGVMTNAPEFPWHLTNLRNYLNINPKDCASTSLGGQRLNPLGTGTGLMGIPGDFSSVSRFVRAAFLRNKIVLSDTTLGGIYGFFHLLDNVAMIKGGVVTLDDHDDFTSYSSCMDLAAGIYYFKTYDDPKIRSISFSCNESEILEITRFAYEEK